MRSMSPRFGIFLAPFDELADPRRLADVAARAEAHGWDGVFLWDHVAYDAPVRAVADPWVAMSAMACATERVVLGPLVTPLARRRIQKLARETVSLDHLSDGRLVLGAGLGGDRGGELSRFGEELDPRARARLLDEGLARLEAYWGGELEPRPVQRPRIPVWLAARWPNRRPVRRAARWDGLFPIDLPGPDALGALAGEIREERREDAGPFDLVVTDAPGTDAAPWIAAGATWCLTGFGSQPRLAEVEAVIAAGPPG
jgi:alkanesulfonate monooxygenase SsuD/methylene tetrahydromethanopterin reductase-like flavin-dependent oxidoreductase (luciferase family)